MHLKQLHVAYQIIAKIKHSNACYESNHVTNYILVSNEFSQSIKIYGINKQIDTSVIKPYL